MHVSGKRVKRTRLIRTERLVVAVEVEAVIPDAEPSEPVYEPHVVELLRQVQSRAQAGDLAWLRRHGRVYVEAA